MALTRDDRQHCANVCVRGEIVLREMGWDHEKRRAFLVRKDVQREMKVMAGLYADRDGLAERAKFFGLIELQKMVPRAIDVLRQALHSGQKAKDSTGAEVTIQPPDESAYDAAIQVLDRTGVDAGKFTTHTNMPTIGNLNITENHLNVGDAKENNQLQNIVKRERVRSLLDAILNKAKSGGNYVEAEVIPTKKSKDRSAKRIGSSENTDEED